MSFNFVIDFAICYFQRLLDENEGLFCAILIYFGLRVYRLTNTMEKLKN